jgi:hypothetical protein
MQEIFEEIIRKCNEKRIPYGTEMIRLSDVWDIVWDAAVKHSEGRKEG